MELQQQRGLTLRMKPVLVAAEIASCSRMGGWGLPSPVSLGEERDAVLNSGLGQGMLLCVKALIYPKQVSPHSNAKFYCSEGTHVT